MAKPAEYSTLEVLHPHEAPEVLHTPVYKESIPSPVTWQSSEAPEHVSPKYEGTQPVDATPPPRPARSGLSRKAIIIWSIVGVVLLAALIGGLAGGLTKHNSNSSSDDNTGSVPNTTTPAPVASPIGDSQLAALNYTDSSNTSRRAVFYQYDGSLFCARFYSSNVTWIPFNISAALDSASAGDNLAIKSSTPIAAAAIPKEDVDYLRTVYGNYNFAAALYVMGTDNRIRELVSHDYELESWAQGGLNESVLYAAEDSKLAAAGNFCPNSTICSDAMSVMYQDTSANIKMTNGTNWSNAVQVDVGYPGASLAAVPFNKDSGSNFTWVTDVRMFYYSNTAVRTASYDWEGLVEGTTAIITNQEVESGKVPQVVASTSNFHSQSVVVSMDGDGNFTASFYDYEEGWEYSQSTTFKNQDGSQSTGGPNVAVTSIAMDQNKSLYGIVANSSTISRYAWDPVTPFTFTWAEDISVAL